MTKYLTRTEIAMYPIRNSKYVNNLGL